ncbi:response regulator transcription factor [Tenuibacillus multivorans]|uniref:DNA-binding response regulator, NarL/FixJ family, contains REC and HTH domains n=1 Tax=Tenuibacillus multivorans TaxID=237069 RepID=A0A1H0EWN1_9BACI|nr:response regulator transcription factor [Tenuibacillus multivorans]GEL76927.1 DNA-binding response regulator [Tenuibacillus multivorans]SDN86778.1 DNA-binding response regulator, NarL/FixJ family, contains REC and HTH domains [Tenuibacillus multivorans]
MNIKVLLVDDHEVVRKGLIYFLNTKEHIEVVGEASNGEEALKFLESNEVDVCVLDIQMPHLNGIDTTKILKRDYPHIHVLVLTSFLNDEYVVQAIQNGASGYLLKDSDPEKLCQAIENVYLNQEMIDEKAAVHLFKHIKKNNAKSEEEKRLDELTNRELDVLQEIMNGKSNKAIAQSLFVTEKTVKTHISNILSKLEVQDRTQAALFGVKFLDTK